MLWKNDCFALQLHFHETNKRLYYFHPQATDTYLVNDDPSRGPGMPECFLVSDTYRVLAKKCPHKHTHTPAHAHNKHTTNCPCHIDVSHICFLDTPSSPSCWVLMSLLEIDSKLSCSYVKKNKKTNWGIESTAVLV